MSERSCTLLAAAAAAALPFVSEADAEGRVRDSDYIPTNGSTAHPKNARLATNGHTLSLTLGRGRVRVALCVNVHVNCLIGRSPHPPFTSTAGLRPVENSPGAVK